MNVVLFGGTGMVGQGVLLECLDDARVDSVLTVGRRATGVTHPKVKELVRHDLSVFDDLTNQFSNVDACFFCLGVSAAGKSEADYRAVTYDLTIAAANALQAASPHITFCYVSGEGTDSTEQGRSMWARVKGKTENDLLRSPLTAYMFRPGMIQPLRGVRSRTRAYRAAYAVTKPLFPILQRLLPTHVTTSVNVGRAMIEVAESGYDKDVLENPDINAVAARSASTDGAE